MFLALFFILLMTLVFAIVYIVSMKNGWQQIPSTPVLTIFPSTKTEEPFVPFSPKVHANNNGNAHIEELCMEIEDLQWMLEKKKRELDEVKQLHSVNTESAMILETLTSQLELLQSRLNSVERQTALLSSVSYELEDAQSTLMGVEKQTTALQDTLAHALTEKDMMRLQLDDAQTEIAELNFQNRQLQKRVKMLESINQELTGLADTMTVSPPAGKAQLHSRLQLLQDEKDHLRNNWK